MHISCNLQFFLIFARSCCFDTYYTECVLTSTVGVSLQKHTCIVASKNSMVSLEINVYQKKMFVSRLLYLLKMLLAARKG